MIRKVIHGDCLDKMSLLPDKYFDLILTDLPYGTTACKWDIIIPFDKLWEHYKRIIKKSAPILLFGSEPFSSYLRISNIFNYKYDWVWEKDKGTGAGFSKKQPLRKTENISVFYASQPYYDSQGEKLDKPYTRVLPTKKSNSYNISSKNTDANGERIKVEYTHKTKTNLIYFSRDNANRGFHETAKPVALCEYLIKTYTNENDIILDNCAGSFTTAVAADNLKRQWICIEKEEEYVKIGVDRINKNAELLGLEKVNYE